MKKTLFALIACILFLSMTFTPNAQAKTMWGKIEAKKGMIGKVIVVKDTYLYKYSNHKMIKNTKVKKGKEFGIYSIKSSKYYHTGKSIYAKKGSTIKYVKIPKSIANKLKSVSLSTKIGQAKSFDSLYQVLATAKWGVEKDVDGGYVRFMATKNVNPYGLSTGFMTVRTQKVGGWFIDVGVSNPNDQQVLDATKRSLQLLGISVNTDQFTSIVIKAKSTREVQQVKWGKHIFWVSCSDDALVISEREGETHFR
ncbi:hypothetical protein G6549_23345 [Bacillus sp. MM2020_1]|nr:hypothetical protein [Bacillus sp. MM2020_1]